ncbi:5785283e-d88b-4fe9-a9ad-6c6e7c975ddb [Thermothielavioides terrestris]|uniref:5785283e-d88b-4fe9-a9ad-6c6e7c975ddb n=1 Tax=Thermothielavioides terrestris TaxID=2587410 RepID=A0A446BD53_9PEZI|nr:5785283e-d88b-4fe9-a9ad-6c6e7c975ddb [Thermothielavioides terrestris]
MLATPAQTAFPPPHFPSEPNHHHHHPTDTDDPFQALHNSLANLSLTAPAHPPPREIPTATAPPDQSPIRATPLFPPGDNVVFAHSSFFRRHSGPSASLSSSSSSPPAELPSLAQVRAQAAWLSIAAGNYDGGAGMEMDDFADDGDGYGGGAGGGGVVVDEQAGAKTVPFAELGLAVRYGPRVSAAEGKAMMFVRRALGRSVDSGPLQDALFQGCRAAGAPPPGPFPTVSALHDYFASMAAAVPQSRYAGESGLQVQLRLRHLFPDNHPVAFTHGGLHPRNIVVSAGPNPRVVAIIGWEQAGWYPAYWELCKARWDCARHGSLGDWERKYLPWILDADGLQRELPDWN